MYKAPPSRVFAVGPDTRTRAVPTPSMDQPPPQGHSLLWDKPLPPSYDEYRVRLAVPVPPLLPPRAARLSLSLLRGVLTADYSLRQAYYPAYACARERWLLASDPKSNFLNCLYWVSDCKVIHSL